MKIVKSITLAIVCSVMFGCAAVSNKQNENNLTAANTNPHQVDDARAEAKILLSSMGLEKILSQSMEQMLDIQIKQNPSLLPYKAVMIEFLAKHMSYKSIEPEMIRIYSEAFSAQELRDINNFYQTPTGKKTIELMPALVAQGAEIGAKRVEENATELQQMILKESERLQNSQSN